MEEARAILLRQGTIRFGPPAPQTQAAIEAITAIERLELLSERLLDVESWDELLAADGAPISLSSFAPTRQNHEWRSWTLPVLARTA